MAYKHSYGNTVRVDGAKLTNARLSAGKSLEDVAQYLGCNKSSVSRWEQGSLVPSESRILQMVMFFNNHSFLVENLVGGKGGNS